MNNQGSAEQILNNIFNIMQRLYNEMTLNENVESNHFRIFGIFAELGRTLVGADRASFWRWDKEEHKLITTAATGIDQIIIADNVGLVGRSLAEKRPIITNDPYNHPDFNSAVDKKTGYVTKSILVMPVSNCKGETIGAFQVINKLSSENGFDEIEDLKRLSIATFICGMALESDLFLADSQRDKLTKLKNRFGFYSDCQTKYKRFLNDSNNITPMSLIICDIDFFKKVNDTYGHNGGDDILKHVARILKSEICEGDSVYRWGGEEFIILLKGKILSEAVSKAEDIRLKIMASICHFDKKEIHITMSFGCVEVNPAISVEENIKIADTYLYHAKETGRNRVVSTISVV